VVLLALLAIRSIAYAQRKSSIAASQPQQGSTNVVTVPETYPGPAYPMWGSGGGNQAGNSAGSYGPMGPGMVYGGSIPSQYGGMGSGMMGGWADPGQYGAMGRGMMGGWSNGGQFGGMGGRMMR
jgi:hypothetical protein